MGKKVKKKLKSRIENERRTPTESVDPSRDAAGGVNAKTSKKRERGESQGLPGGGVVKDIRNTGRNLSSKGHTSGVEGSGIERQAVKRRKKGRGPQTEKKTEDGKGINTGYTMLKFEKRKQNAVVDTVLATERIATAPVVKPTKFLDKMRARLSGGQFRSLNETLYTCKGEDAYKLFKRDPAAFTLYHNGYQEQMSRWPVVPIEVVISWLRSRSPELTVADFGCGDARLAKSVKNKVFSIDLMSNDPAVISCNMAETPLSTASVDVAVFCLSLMGTDYPSFIQEAHRVIKESGSLIIAEVKSRFASGGVGTTPEQFIGALESAGFSLVSQDASNKMFIMFYLQKHKGTKKPRNHNIQWPKLKACIYKRR